MIYVLSVIPKIITFYQCVNIISITDCSRKVGGHIIRKHYLVLRHLFYGRTAGAKTCESVQKTLDVLFIISVPLTDFRKNGYCALHKGGDTVKHR